MIEIMDEINNHFLTGYPELGVYTVVSDGIEGSFSETYLPGMYVIINNSYLNDGIYKIASVSATKITVEETLIGEDTEDSFLISPSAPPKAFVDLAAEIENFSESVGATSESIDDYSVTYGTDGSWESAFASKLNKYRKMYNDIDSSLSNYPNWQRRDDYGY